MTFVDPNWRIPLQHLLAALERISGGPSPTPTELTDDAVLTICSQMVRRACKPGAWAPPQPPSPWPPAPPPLNAAGAYTLVSLNAADPFSEHYSMSTGGILFEDPFYAVLACYNAGYRRKLSVLPTVADWQEAWARRPQIVQSITARTYDPSNWFIDCLPGPSRELKPEFLPVAGADLANLRVSGLADLRTAAGLAKYALYFRK